MNARLSLAVLALSTLQASAQKVPADPLDPSKKPTLNDNSAAYPTNIWVTGPLEKVLQEKGAPGSGHSAIVYAARNEIQSFQVHIHAAAPIKALEVTVSDLVNAQTKTRISAASTDIIVYREAYENVAIKTATGATFLNTTGHIPDILIPAIDPYYHQKTNAFPFTVEAGANQSVWVDVHIPLKARSGYYSGTVTVRDGAAVLADLPLVYAVWDWEMPSTASLPSFTQVSYGGFCFQAYGPAGCSTYPGAQGIADYGVTLSNVDASVQMLDNRYSLSGITNIFPGEGSFDAFDRVYGPLLNGTRTFAGAAAHITGILEGARLTSYNLVPLPKQITAATFQNFQKHFAANHWVTPFYALVDEPKDEPAVWNMLISSGTQSHGFAPTLPTMVTIDLPMATKHAALDAIDWLVVNLVTLEPGGRTPMQDLSAYRQWLAANPKRKFWSYQGCSDAGTCTNSVVGPQYRGVPNTYPNYNIDGTPVANRTLEWLTYLHGQTGELYYYVDVCDGPTGEAKMCGYPPPPSPNPLVTVYYSGGWGDGTLMYPGSPGYVGTKIPIWLPSLRLKMIRDGMQDYEYLYALNQAGEGPFATQQALSFITNSYTFDNKPSALEAARMAMGTRLHQLAAAKGQRAR